MQDFVPKELEAFPDFPADKKLFVQQGSYMMKLQGLPLEEEILVLHVNPKTAESEIRREEARRANGVRRVHLRGPWCCEYPPNEDGLETWCLNLGLER